MEEYFQKLINKLCHKRTEIIEVYANVIRTE